MHTRAGARRRGRRAGSGRLGGARAPAVAHRTAVVTGGAARFEASWAVWACANCLRGGLVHTSATRVGTAGCWRSPARERGRALRAHAPRAPDWFTATATTARTREQSEGARWEADAQRQERDKDPSHIHRISCVIAWYISSLLLKRSCKT